MAPARRGPSPLKVKRWLASVMISTLITCGGGGPPSTPSTPAPSSPPALSALTATSAGFIDQNGEIVRLRGVSYIPPDSTIYGWPSTISVEVLSLIHISEPTRLLSISYAV